MPGIAGIIAPGRPDRRAAVRQLMAGCLRHEPFYQTGTFEDNQLGISVTWTNHPGSGVAAGPTWNAAGDIGLVLIGEYIPENGRGDAAADLLAQYEQQGPAFLAGCNDWLQGVVLDRREQKIILFNDRYWLRRLSEIRAE